MIKKEHIILCDNELERRILISALLDIFVGAHISVSNTHIETLYGIINFVLKEEINIANK